jgi:tRNA dimethylallyltransferase
LIIKCNFAGRSGYECRLIRYEFANFLKVDSLVHQQLPIRPLLVILGPTASGKTHLATRVAACLNGEVISVDSRQVYRGMDIGTGKDLDEYHVDQKDVPYHLIDVVDAGEKYNLSRFQKDFHAVCDQMAVRGSVPVVCGGSGLYLNAVLRGYGFTEIPTDNSLRERLESYGTEDLLTEFLSLDTAYSSLADTSTRKRLIRAIEISRYLLDHPELSENDFSMSPRYPFICFGLNPPVEVRRERISVRLRQRLAGGLIEEVKGLMDKGLSEEQLIYYGLEYKYITAYLTGALTRSDMEQRLETEIHRFAKRQMTFFRKMEKDGVTINWLDDAWAKEEIVAYITKAYLAFEGQHN